MKDKRPIAIAIVLAVSALAVGCAWVWSAPHRAAVAANGGANGSGTRNASGTRNGSDTRAGSDTRNEGSGTRVVGLPKDTILQPTADEAEVSGAIICGSCRFGTKEPCNVMIWNRTAKHLYTVLPNDQLTRLEELIPEECS